MLTLMAMPESKRGRKADPSTYRHTKYGEWFRKAASKAAVAMGTTEYDLHELGRKVGSDYNYMWQLFSGRKLRPGPNLAVRIGRELGDIRGSLAAADAEMTPDFEREIAEQEYMKLVLGNIDGKPATLTISRDASEEDIERLKAAFRDFQGGSGPADYSLN